MPSFARQMMPPPLLNGSIRTSGTRLQWMKSHVCPCTMATDIGGSPNPQCKTCHGRGRYWEPPGDIFIGLRTFMHTSEAADEPGVLQDPRIGQALHAEPTITIPSDVEPVWSDCSELDAFLEIDTLIRFETAFVTGGNTVLPYQQNLEVQNVTAYDNAANQILPLSTNRWRVNAGDVSLIGFPPGTAFTVMYKASPVWIAWRRAGALPHTRMFGGGTAPLPTRFRAMLLDVWTRTRNPFGQSASPQSSPAALPPAARDFSSDFSTDFS